MNKIVRLSCIGLAFAALAACAPEFNPPADYKGGFLWDAGQGRTVTVQAGDTLYTLSRRYNVPTRAIISRNGLQPPYELRVGQQLILDPARIHTIKPGDTLSQIARAYGVEMRLIAEANDLAPPYVVVVGKTLWIPDPFQAAAAPIAADDLPPVNVAVPSGQAPRSTPILKEQLAPPPGQDGFPTPQQDLPRELNTSPESLPQSQEAAALPPPAQLEEPKPLNQSPPRSAARFAWPLKGKVISGFGSSGKGLHNDGINIAAAAGTEVQAADNGVVAYAGNELKGFGNLLLIKHADGMITAYAHNDKLLVQRGDEVQRGQVISTVGRTGNVDTPQLHFEVRKGTQSLDPMKFLDPA
jgi:murein DD-endopeptidase MepM/ murein hydrolase activator NlpD